MRISKTSALAAILLTTQYAFADASYETRSQITGGTLVDTLKSSPFAAHFMGKMFDPTSSIIMVHGNQKATVSKDSIEIIDLDKEEMIHIDKLKKTYTVTTFAQTRQAFADMTKKMQQAPAAQPQPQAPPPNLKINVDTSVKNTGVTKIVNGLSAQEQIITVKMIITDPNAAAAPAATPGQPTSMTYVVTTDAWIAPDPPELKQIEDFDVRMGQKMMAGIDLSAFASAMKANVNANPGMAQMFGSKPGSGEAMAQMRKEMAKIKGMHVLEITSMGGDAPVQPGATPPPPAAAAPSSGSVAGQVATDTATQTASSESSHLGTFGSALSSSAFSAFRRKKSTPPPAPPPAPAANTPATPGAQGTTRVVLMEMTQQETNFSTEAVPASVFQVPAGYKQVASPMAAQ